MKKLFILSLLSLTANASNSQNREVRLNTEDNTANEPSIAISKKHYNVIVAASNLNWIYWSDLNGKAWQSYQAGSSLGFYGDPVVVAADNGDFYLVHLSQTPGKKWGDWFDRIVFQKSTDEGVSFTDGVGIGYNQDRTQDKPWLSTGPSGYLYLTWTEFDKYGSELPEHYSKIMFSMSMDRGDTWSDPIVISDEMGGCKDDDNTLEGATTAIGSDGTVYVTWAGKEKIYMDKSVDGGKTFGEDRVVAEQKGGWVLDIPHLYRSNGMPFLQIDRSKKEKGDELYLVYTTHIDSVNTVVLSKSTDQGKSWKRIKEATGPYYGQQFFPNLAVDPNTGDLVLGFYDAPVHLSGNFANYHTSISFDGGETFKLNTMTAEPFPIPDKSVFFGDYSDVDIVKGHTACIYATYTPPTWKEGSKMNVIYNKPGSFNKRTSYRYAEEGKHVWRDNYLSIVMPPYSKLVVKSKSDDFVGKKKRKEVHYNETPNQWREIQVSSSELETIKVKYKIKYQPAGSRFPIKIKNKTFQWNREPRVVVE